MPTKLIAIGVAVFAVAGLLYLVQDNARKRGYAECKSETNAAVAAAVEKQASVSAQAITDAENMALAAQETTEDLKGKLDAWIAQNDSGNCVLDDAALDRLQQITTGS